MSTRSSLGPRHTFTLRQQQHGGGAEARAVRWGRGACRRLRGRILRCAPRESLGSLGSSAAPSAPPERAPASAITCVWRCAGTPGAAAAPRWGPEAAGPPCVQSILRRRGRPYFARSPLAPPFEPPGQRRTPLAQEVRTLAASPITLCSVHTRRKRCSHVVEEVRAPVPPCGHARAHGRRAARVVPLCPGQKALRGRGVGLRRTTPVCTASSARASPWNALLMMSSWSARTSTQRCLSSSAALGASGLNHNPTSSAEHTASAPPPHARRDPRAATCAPAAWARHVAQQ